MENIKFDKGNAVRIKTLKVSQPIGTFYVGVAKASDAIQICQAQERQKDADALEEYIGIQRELNKKRVDEIKTYVGTWDASFPNSVILAINPDSYIFEGDEIFILKDKNSANIIDGQHRLAGFDQTTGKDFEIILTLFPELELEEQAYLFSVINTKMTRINPSLSQDLLDFATIPTPEKLTHNIAKDFYHDQSNPWYKKIKMLGSKEEGTDPSLSQSTFTREILAMICRKEDSYKVRDILKRNNNKRSSLAGFYSPATASRFVFWDAYIRDEDKFIYTVLRDFFLAVRNEFPSDWDDSNKILTKTTGYGALMKIFKHLVRKGFEEKDLTKEYFANHLRLAVESGKLKEFNSSNYNPGKVGETNLSNDFLIGMNLISSSGNEHARK